MYSWLQEFQSQVSSQQAAKGGGEAQTAPSPTIEKDGAAIAPRPDQSLTIEATYPAEQDAQEIDDRLFRRGVKDAARRKWLGNAYNTLDAEGKGICLAMLSSGSDDEEAKAVLTLQSKAEGIQDFDQFQANFDYGDDLPF